MCSRFYVHHPPGENDDLLEHCDVPASLKADVAELEKAEPVVNSWVCIITLMTTVIFLAFTAEHVCKTLSLKPIFLII